MRTHVEKKLKEYIQQGNRHTPKDNLTQNTGKKEKVKTFQLLAVEYLLCISTLFFITEQFLLISELL